MAMRWLYVWTATALFAAGAGAALAQDRSAKIENGAISVTVDPASGAMSVLDKRNGYLWQPGETAGPSAKVSFRRAATAPTLDGKLEEWGAPAAITLAPDAAGDIKPAAGKVTTSAKAWAAWDQGGLYLAVAVHDEKLVLGRPSEEQWWEKDSIEFWVGSRQYGVRLFDGGANLWTAAGDLPDAKAAWQPTADGYSVEVFIPAADMPDAALQAGRTFRFALGINDAGASGKRETQLYFPRGWQHSNPETFAVATLAVEDGSVPAAANDGPAPILRNLKADAARRTVTYETDLEPGKKTPAQITLTLDPTLPEVSVSIDIADHSAPVGLFRALKPLALDDPNGFIFFAPYCDGIAVPCDLLSWRGRDWGYPRIDMPWVGVSDGKKGYMTLCEDPDDSGMELTSARTAKGELLCPGVFHYPQKNAFGYTRRVRYAFFNEGGYVAACKWYRKYAKGEGLVRTLKTKMQTKPELAKLAGAPDVWGASGLQFAREAKAAGIDRMLINYVGSGEDMQKMRDLGYLVSCYDNYCDINGPGPEQYNDVKLPDDCLTQSNGDAVKGWLTYDKKTQYYERCPGLAEAAARKWIPKDLEKHPYNARFLDVTTAMCLVECWSKVHPLTRTGHREASRGLAKFVGDDLKLVLGGEHGRWWGADIYDYWEGMQSGGFYSWPAGQVGEEIPQTRAEIGKDYLEWGIGAPKRLPLWELVFGDCVKSTWYWGDSTGHLYKAAPDIADAQDCFNILYGTLPLYWVEQPYSFNWHVPELRARLLRSYRDTCKLNEQIGFEEMVRHEWLTLDRTVQRTTFADGTRVTVNFGPTPYSLKDGGTTYTLAQYGFYAKGPKVLQYKATVQQRQVERISTPGYLFCDAAGKEHDFGPVRTAGQVTLRQEGPDTLRVNLGSADTRAAVVPAQMVPGWDASVVRIIRLDDSGTPTRCETPQVRDGAIVLDGSASPVMIVSGAAARKPDLVASESSITVSPATPKEGDVLRVAVSVRNDGGAAGTADVALYRDTISAATRLGVKPVTVAAGKIAQLSFDVATKGLDGQRRLIVQIDPENRLRELVKTNDLAVTPVEIAGDYANWGYGINLDIDTGDVARLDEPVVTAVDLTAATGIPVGARPDPASVRVVEVQANGGFVRSFPAQFDPDETQGGVAGARGTLTFILPGETPAHTKLRLRFMFKSAPGVAAAMPTVTWDPKTQTVTAPAYSVRFQDGVLFDIHDLLSSSPEKVAIQSIPVSSQETGWVTEEGKVASLETLSAGPARVVVRVRKSLSADYQTDKTYTFYPRHFEVDFAANKPGVMPSRAYYAMPGRFEDSGGTRAMMDGQGNDEGVSGKNPNPQWYAIYSDVWAHSCVALGGLGTIGYWDCGNAWGGISFTTGVAKGVRMAYVFHPGQKDASFAERDYRRLSVPVSVR